ncbi:MAG TPA: mannose-1-phosphate guanylyltransferase [Oculatellaceae cyanobacterium]|jgi:mannose-1-phosphate guanylyltransferase/mannose-6-phosphate isomerase
MPRLFPMILAGGVGARLWPLSTQDTPKQFLPLITEHSLLQEAAMRLTGLAHAAPPSVVCNARHRLTVVEQLHAIQVQPRRVLLEPVGRNTAPAMAVAAWDVVAEDPEGLLLVTPSDLTMNTEAFHVAVQQAVPMALSDAWVLFGIPPTSPKPDYGYILRGEPLSESKNSFQVAAFIEKPDADAAAQYVASGRYFWNSGLYLVKAYVMLAQLQQFSPEIYEASRCAAQAARREENWSRLDEAELARCPVLSIDHAVLEKTDRAVMFIPENLNWRDLGSWNALLESRLIHIGGNTANVIRN